jgi:hypothetical protein
VEKILLQNLHIFLGVPTICFLVCQSDLYISLRTSGVLWHNEDANKSIKILMHTSAQGSEALVFGDFRLFLESNFLGLEIGRLDATGPMA